VNTPSRLAAALGISTLFVLSAVADDQAQHPAPAPQYAVRVELLVVDLSQAKALALLPALRDPAKIDGAVDQIMAAIDQKEATLVGYPILQAVDGEEASSSQILEKRYPTEFDPPVEIAKVLPVPPRMVNAPVAPGSPPETVPQTPLPPNPLHLVSLPTSFETRNIGLIVIVTPHVLSDGNWILLDIEPSSVILQRFEIFVTDITQPQFVTLGSPTKMAVRNGEHTLLAVHKIPGADNQVEVEIVQATATPIK